MAGQIRYSSEHACEESLCVGNVWGYNVGRFFLQVQYECISYKRKLQVCALNKLPSVQWQQGCRGGCPSCGNRGVQTSKSVQSDGI